MIQFVTALAMALGLGAGGINVGRVRVFTFYRLIKFPIFALVDNFILAICYNNRRLIVISI